MQPSNQQLSDIGRPATSSVPERASGSSRPPVLNSVSRALRSFFRKRAGRAAVHILVSEERESRRRGESWERCLARSGVRTMVAPLGKESFRAILGRHGAFVVAGSPSGPRLNRFLANARDNGRPVVLDSAPLAVPPESMLELLGQSGPPLPWNRSLAINWVVRAPIAERSGRSQVVFRIANELGRRGHRVRVYIDPVAHLSRLSPGEIVDYTERYFGPLSLEPIIGLRQMSDADVSISTCWKSSEFVARDEHSLFQFRLIQELEESLAPENHRYFQRARAAYQLPLQAVAFGRTLAPKIADQSPGSVEAIDLAVDQSRFFAARSAEQPEHPHRILFYARPDRAERGFALGVEALRLLSQRYPDLEITLFGAQEEDIGPLGFVARHVGIPSPTTLASEMNRAQVVLSLSLSGTVSSVAMESMACGAVVVESELSGLEAILSPGEGFRLAAAEPAAIANTIGDIFEDSELRARLVQAGLQAMQRRDWSSSFNQFERILLERCFATTNLVDRPAHLAVSAAG